MSRLLWNIAGATAVLLGIIGIILPLLPTVPFLLLAAFCFARGSERAHQWLVNHKRLGPPIRDWQEHGAIRRRAKIAATCACLAVLGLSLILGLRWQLIAIQMVTLGCVLVFIWTRPES